MRTPCSGARARRRLSRTYGRKPSPFPAPAIESSAVRRQPA